MAKKKDLSGIGGTSGNGDSVIRDHGDTRSDWPERPAWVSDSRDGGGQGYDAAGDSWLEGVAPTLYQFLTLQGWGGKQRKPGTIRIFAEEGKWKCCLNDNEAGRYAFVSADSLEKLLGAVEAGLGARGMDWRPNKKWK